MKKIIYKWFMDWEKEEAWLNRMAAQGLCLTGVGVCRYEFEECTPGEYGIRMELLENLPNHPESERYIRFMEETGAEHISNFMRWVYFRKKTADGPFELFSDAASKIKHINRILLLLGVLAGCNLYSGGYNIFLALTVGFAANWLGLINVVLAVVIGILFLKNLRKKRKLQEQQKIYEA